MCAMSVGGRDPILRQLIFGGGRCRIDDRFGQIELGASQVFQVIFPRGHLPAPSPLSIY